MSASDEFLASMLPRLLEADTAIHNGDAQPRKALWSTRDPVTLFGAAITATGWPALEATFDQLAARFSGCRSFEIEVVAAGAADDLAYLVAYEHTTASIAGKPPVPHTLRVTTIFRREDGDWKVVHRHGDALLSGDDARERLAALGSAEPGKPPEPA